MSLLLEIVPQPKQNLKWYSRVYELPKIDKSEHPILRDGMKKKKY